MRSGTVRPWWTIIIVCLALLPLGCKKQPYLKTVEQTPYLGFPGGLDQIIQVDLSDLRNRDDFDQMKADWEASPQFGPLLKGLRDQAGFDPLQQIDHLSLAQKGPADAKNPFKNMILIAQGRFDGVTASIEKLPPFLGSEYLIAPPPFKRTEQAGSMYYQMSAQSQYDESVMYDINIGVPSKSLLVVGFNAPLVKSVLDVIGGQATGIQQDKVWLEMLKRVNTGATLWGTGNLVQATMQRLAGMNPAFSSIGQARQFFFNVGAVQDLKAEVGLVCETIDQATKLTGELKTIVDQMKPGLAVLAKAAPTMAQLPDKLVIVTELQTSKINLHLTGSELHALQQEAQKLAQLQQQLPK